jgi:hypothetical protein
MMTEKTKSNRYEGNLSKKYFEGSNRSPGGSLRTLERIKYETKKMGKFGSASRVRRIEITDEERKRYEPANRD